MPPGFTAGPLGGSRRGWFGRGFYRARGSRPAGPSGRREDRPSQHRSGATACWTSAMTHLAPVAGPRWPPTSGDPLLAPLRPMVRALSVCAAFGLNARLQRPPPPPAVFPWAISRRRPPPASNRVAACSVHRDGEGRCRGRGLHWVFSSGPVPALVAIRSISISLTTSPWHFGDYFEIRAVLLGVDWVSPGFRAGVAAAAAARRLPLDGLLHPPAAGWSGDAPTI